MDKTEAEIKNAELTLASLRSDTLKAAADLTEAFAAKDKAEKETEEALKTLSEAQNATAKAFKELEDERARMRMERAAHEAWVARAKKELDVLKTQKSEAMSELARINEWIFSGENTKRELDLKIVNMQEQLIEYDRIGNAIIDLRDQKHLAEQERNTVQLEANLARDEAENVLLNLKAEKEEVEKGLAIAKEMREQEEIKLYDLRNDRLRIQKDIDVIVLRLEEKFGEAFPELKMKI